MSAQDLEQQASRSWWTRCEPNTDLGDANAEIGFMREDWQKIGEALGFTDFVDPEVIIAAITSLRHQPAPIDLEQFRLAVECYRDAALSANSVDAERVAEADRLLSIIDNAGKVEAEMVLPAAPDRMAIKMLVAAGYITAERANEALRIAHDTHAFALARQPAPVVDDAMRKLARSTIARAQGVQS